MPPRRAQQQQPRVEEVYARDNDNQLEQRIGRILDQKMEQMTEQLTQRLTTLLGNSQFRRRPQRVDDAEDRRVRRNLEKTRNQYEAMNDFEGFLRPDYGFKPSSIKAAPIARSRSARPASNFYGGTHELDSIFAARSTDFASGILGGSARRAARSPPKAYDVDSVFEKRVNPEPVYDKPVYDDDDVVVGGGVDVGDIFCGVPGIRSSTSSATAATNSSSKVNFDDVFRSVSSSPQKMGGNAATAFDDLLGGFGKAEPAPAQSRWKSSCSATSPERSEKSVSDFDGLVRSTSSFSSARETWESLNLRSASDYKYLSQSSCYSISGVNDAEQFRTVMEALDVVHISTEDQQSVFSMLAAVLWLENISFDVIDNENHVEAVEDEGLSTVAKLIECDIKELKLALLMVILLPTTRPEIRGRIFSNPERMMWSDPRTRPMRRGAGLDVFGAPG